MGEYINEGMHKILIQIDQFYTDKEGKESNLQAGSITVTENNFDERRFQSKSVRQNLGKFLK